MKLYIQVNNETKIITDCITTYNKNYIEIYYELKEMIHGGWYRYLNGDIVRDEGLYQELMIVEETSNE